MAGQQSYRRTLLVLLLSAGSCEPAFSFSVTPVARFTALGGEFFTTSAQSTGTNLEAVIAPVIGLRPDLVVVPLYSGSYKEVPSVYDFLGESTIIQKQWDHLLSIRFVYALNDYWRFKPRMGYKKELLQQNTDPDLSNALFNYNRIFGGASLEHLYNGGSVELGYEYGLTRYPNYQAVVSDPLLIDTGLTTGAGTDILDFNSHETSLSWQFDTASRRWHFSNAFVWLRENFIDQRIISQDENNSESFVNKQRTDDIFGFTFQQVVRLNTYFIFALGEGLQYYTSNQNAYDGTQASVPFYTYRYYDYTEGQLNPTLSFTWRRFDTAVTGLFSYRKYSHRLTQDANGNLQTDLIHSFSRGFTATTRYRITNGLYAVLSRTIVTYVSNTSFEQDYPYNYAVFNVYGGLSWEY